MKFTLSWLKEHLDAEADLAALEAVMIRGGLEVEEITDPSAKLAAFTVCRIVSVAQHPNADRLQVCQVDTIDGRKEIVCGGLNARAGLVTAYAPIGAYIPGTGITLVPKPVRGVVSNGMLCSGAEMETDEDPFGLRQTRRKKWLPRAAQLGLTEDQAIADGGIIELPDSAAVGAPVAGLLGAADPVIDFEVTPNRPDWLGVQGIARDLAALGFGKVRAQKVKPVAGGFDCPIAVRIEAPEACPVFRGRLIRGVTNGPSPDWMQKRLKAIGVNPKNLLVDCTNYLSFDRARPSHVYDAAKLTGAVVARFGRPGERFTALDGRDVEVGPDMCVIADDSGVIGLGGVMGGAATSVSDATTDVFIECAWFDPDRTARTGRTTGVLSDARFRYERGVDPLSQQMALDWLTAMILAHGGGEASRSVVAGAEPAWDRMVSFRPADMKRLTGVAMKPARMKTILKSLGFSPVTPTQPAGDTKGGGDVWPWKVPPFRPDVSQSADIVEELIRVEGFDALPDEPLPPQPATTGSRVVVTPLQNRVRVSRRVLAARGYLEAVTWSFMSRARAAAVLGGEDRLSDTLTLDNPIAAELDYMRPTILANLAEAAQRNVDHGAGEVRLFETGPVYSGDGPGDQRTLAAALVRPVALRHWGRGSGEQADAFTIKADLFALLEALDQPGDRFQIAPPEGPMWHPGRAATLKLGPKLAVATFGELHPVFLKALKVDGPMLGFELVLDAMPAAKAKAGKTKPVLDKADLTPIRRDFAFVVNEAVAAGDIVKAAAKADPKLVTQVRAFDVYRGPGVAEGAKSVAIEVTLQPRGAALTDADIEAVAGGIVKAVSKATGGVLRG